MRIALATCSNLPDWEVDDRPLHAALRERGADLCFPAWDDPRFHWEETDACLIRTTWDYAERRDEFVAWARRVERVTELFHPAPVVTWNTRKTYLSQLEEGGVPVVPTVWVERGESVDLGDVMSDRGWERAFFKPAVGSTARETRRFGRSPGQLAPAQRHMERLLAAGETVLLQPYLRSVETLGELSTVFLGGALTHAVRKIPVPGDYRVQDDFGASDERIDPPAELVRASERALEIAGARTATDLLYGRADFLRDDAGAYRLTELELVEPSLFFRHRPEAAEILADALVGRVRGEMAKGRKGRTARRMKEQGGWWRSFEMTGGETSS